MFQLLLQNAHNLFKRSFDRKLRNYLISRLYLDTCSSRYFSIPFIRYYIQLSYLSLSVVQVKCFNQVMPII